MKNSILNPKDAKKLKDWQDRFSAAKQRYADDLARMEENEALYNGDRLVNKNPNKGYGKSQKVSINVRNIEYELIETQVDSAIPMPKVIPIHKEDEEQAKKIEAMLENEVRLMRLDVLNDMAARTVPIQGGDCMHVEWDTTKGFHCTIGGITVNERHPRTVIPQPGITDIENMDYIFVMVPQTKEFIKKKYNVDVKDASDTEIDLRKAEKRDENDDIVTVIKCYYRNEDGNIGLFTWCEEYILEDMEDYQARRLVRCKECGRVKTGDVCECGSKKFEETVEEFEDLTEDIVTESGLTIPAVTYTENFEEIRTKIPYYKPKEIPLILRRNVSRSGKLLGFSDAQVIEDQQDSIKKIGSKMTEKILKGGSIVTLPFGLKIETTDAELKVVRVKNANEAGLIGVKNIQCDISQDRISLAENYEWARNTLGITDSYQGRYDSSAKSGTAKQYAINQAAGRLESKRVMKNVAYAKLYEMMFKFMLAYADQPVPLSKRNSEGAYEFSHFNRYDFLKQDAAGEYYWNDEFIFQTDPTSTIMMNREAMWQQIDLKYQAGAFGPIGEDRTLLAFWTFMEQNDYPEADVCRQSCTSRTAGTDATDDANADGW